MSRLEAAAFYSPAPTDLAEREYSGGRTGLIRRKAWLDAAAERHRQMLLIGRIHPVLVHFPIGLVLAAAAAELIAIHRRRPAWHTVAVANVRAGAAMGVLTAVAGWVLASAPFVEPTRLLSWHGRMGVAAAVAAVGAALFSTWPRVPSRRSVFVYRAALFGAAALVAIAGHLGGMLVWGVGSG